MCIKLVKYNVWEHCFVTYAVWIKTLAVLERRRRRLTRDRHVSSHWYPSSYLLGTIPLRGRGGGLCFETTLYPCVFVCSCSAHFVNCAFDQRRSSADAQRLANCAIFGQSRSALAIGLGSGVGLGYIDLLHHHHHHQIFTVTIYTRPAVCIDKRGMVHGPGYG